MVVMKSANLIEAIKRTGYDPYEYEECVAVNIQKKTWLVFGAHLFYELMEFEEVDEIMVLFANAESVKLEKDSLDVGVYFWGVPWEE